MGGRLHRASRTDPRELTRWQCGGGLGALPARVVVFEEREHCVRDSARLLDVQRMPRPVPDLQCLSAPSTRARTSLWAGVSPINFPALTITEQLVSHGQASSGKRVLAGPVDIHR
jgi:hypothetical protein